jgi:hypothetical protein
MKKLMMTVIITALAGLFAIGIGMVPLAGAQTVPLDVARICMQNIFGQRIDLRVYSASGDWGPTNVWLVNGVFDLTFTCQDPATSLWPVHGSIIARAEPKHFEAITKPGTLFRLNFEAGSIDPGRCVKFKEGLTCRVEDQDDGDADPGNVQDNGDRKDRQPAVSCTGFFTNIADPNNVTRRESWTPIACPEDFFEDTQVQSLPSERMPGFEPAKP